jgi:hypothetical protein
MALEFVRNLTEKLMALGCDRAKARFSAIARIDVQ